MTRIAPGLVVASSNPKELALFYAKAMNIRPERGLNDQHWLVSHPEGLIMEIYCPSSNIAFPLKGSAVAIFLKGLPSQHPLEKIQEWSTNLISEGATARDEPRLEQFGAESWMADPEGNDFLIMVPVH